MRKYLTLGLLMAGCAVGCGPPIKSGESTRLEMEQTENNQKRLAQATPPPQFDHSLERENLVRRLKILNVQNKTMYIYCMGLNGNVVYHGMVQGKVSSLNSLLTTPEQIAFMRDPRGGYIQEKLPSPDFDGSYGKNPEGVFWFSPDGGYHEWSGTYYLSDRPEKIAVPISIVSTVDLQDPVKKEKP